MTAADEERLGEIAERIVGRARSGEGEWTFLNEYRAMIEYVTRELAAAERRGMERAAHICDVTSEHNLDKAAANVGHVAEIFTRQAALAKAIANAIRAAIASEEK